MLGAVCASAAASPSRLGGSGGAGRTFILKKAWCLQWAAADAGGCAEKLWPKDIDP